MLNRTEECVPGSIRFLPAGEPHTNQVRGASTCIQFDLSPHLITRVEDANVRTELLGGEIVGARAEGISRALALEAKCIDLLSSLSIEAPLVALLAEGARRQRASIAVCPEWA